MEVEFFKVAELQRRQSLCKSMIRANVCVLTIFIMAGTVIAINKVVSKINQNQTKLDADCFLCDAKHKTVKIPRLRQKF